MDWIRRRRSTAPGAAPDATPARYCAAAPGTLPDEADGAPEVAGVRLPPGRLIRPDPSMAVTRKRLGAAAAEPVGWIADEPTPEGGRLWAELASRFGQSGLWPLLLDSLPGYPERPWGAGELDPMPPPDGSEDVDAILRGWWHNATAVVEGEEKAKAWVAKALGPFANGFPGLAPPTTGPADESVPAQVAARLPGRLGLVAATRPADAVAVLGWLGPTNWYTDWTALAAVLRSWEDRFGAMLVGLGFDTMALAVRRPPRTAMEAMPVAVEYFAVCGDAVWQGAESISRLAHHIARQPVWTFWWD